MPTVIPGVPPSTEIRRLIAEEGQPVMLAFSGGKDSVAAWLALRDAGVTDIYPVFMYLIPGLSFVDKTMAKFEDFFGVHITQLPHPWLFDAINSNQYQTPNRQATIEAAAMPHLTKNDVNEFALEHLGLPRTVWRCDGVRAADSIARRTAFQKHGAMKNASRHVSPVWDWYKAEVKDYINAAGAPWADEEYAWYGRTFDGIDYRFLEPLARNSPEDYQRVVDWFPLVGIELLRHDIIEDHNKRYPDMALSHRNKAAKARRR